MPRPLLTGCAATAVAASLLALSGLAGAGDAASAGTAQPTGGTPPVTLAITAVSPAYATPGTTVTVSGTLTNISSGLLSGLTVQLRSSGNPFGSRGALQGYADGAPSDDEPVPAAVTPLPATLAPRTTVGWSVTLHPDQLPMTGFGVYPLAAEADDSSQNLLTVDRTFLPYWPGKKALDPRRQQIAWVWPLIDQPRQGLCSGGLLNNGLAASLASGGRLSGLLQAGRQYADIARLTWAIDPALLADVTTMTRQYQVGGAGCQGKSKPASQAAAAWLTGLRQATAGQPFFVTPYADADIAALTRNGLNADLVRAYDEGRSEAAKVLGPSFASAGLDGLAWPADGVADYGVLENLAASDKIDTVLLDSSTMPPSPPQDYTPSAQTTTPDGVGTPLRVLLSDDTLTQILGSASAAPNSRAAAFSVAQRYLAETAMIAAEQPNLGRSIVVAPPRRWDPPAGLGSDLLAETVDAPWLQSVSVGQLAAAKDPTGQVSRQAPAAFSRDELTRSVLNQARQLDQQVALLQSIQVSPDPALHNAVQDVESAAWRGGRSARRQDSALALQLSGYLSGQESKLTIIGPPRVTLTGLAGPVPVSISNGLSYPVTVRLEVGPSSGIRVKAQPPLVTIAPGQQQIKKVEITATNVGSTTLRLRLLTPQGTPLPAQTSVIVQTTHYGTLALVIIGAALGVFVLTLAARALRRGRRALLDRPSSEDPGATPQPWETSPGQDAAVDEPERSGDPEGADNVEASDLAAGHTTDHASADNAAEETDDYAWAPGRADPR